MVPPTLHTRLHYIGGVFVTRALQLLDVFAIGDALAVLWQSGPKDIGNEDNVGHFANGAGCL